MRDNLKVVFFFRQTFLKHYSMNRRERLRIFGSLRAYYSISFFKEGGPVRRCFAGGIHPPGELDK
ncbi:hypothetical protein V512_009875 [Mesotoga sp. Brook.08.105.5.1]|nr:hypothetical protein V512_009875 [Mesotoga sp. Brook.08.105.5.1]